MSESSLNFPPDRRPILGGSPTAFSVRSRAACEAGKPFDILEHCRTLGLQGAESKLQEPTPENIRNIREQVETHGMTVILDAHPPAAETDVPAYEARIRACKEAGAIAVYTYMTARRYEQFQTLDEFRTHFTACQRSVALAEPILRRYQMRLAIENHKGWRAEEQAQWLEHVSSEWVGVCLDFGNNLALCEHPDDTFRRLSPYAIFCHIKDMGMQDHPKGFLLSEVPLGTGCINLQERVNSLWERNPRMLFCLEMITRDPLVIPVLTESYWATFSSPETQIAGQDLAKVLALVRNYHSESALPRVSHLHVAESVETEDGFNLACIEYARRRLGF